MEVNPQVVFERLFGDGNDAAQRRARKQRDHSILDSITHDAASVRKSLGAGERVRLNDYLDGVREIERRVQLVAKAASDLPEAHVRTRQYQHDSPCEQRDVVPPWRLAPWQQARGL